MTLFKVSTADKDSISAVKKTVQDIRRLDPACAHHPYHPDIRRILHTAYSGRVRGSVTAPVTEKAEYPWPVIHKLTPIMKNLNTPFCKQG
jgi:hypothetical protein